MNVTYCRFARVRGIKVPPGRFEGRGRHSNNDVTIATPEKSRFHLLTHPSPAQWAESRRERALGGAATPPARHPVFQTATVCPRARVPGRRTACIPRSPPAKFSISSIAENGDAEGWIHDGER